MTFIPGSGSDDSVFSSTFIEKVKCVSVKSTENKQHGRAHMCTESKASYRLTVLSYNRNISVLWRHNPKWHKRRTVNCKNIALKDWTTLECAYILSLNIHVENEPKNIKSITLFSISLNMTLQYLSKAFKFYWTWEIILRHYSTHTHFLLRHLLQQVPYSSSQVPKPQPTIACLIIYSIYCIYIYVYTYTHTI